MGSLSSVTSPRQGETICSVVTAVLFVSSFAGLATERSLTNLTDIVNLFVGVNCIV